MPQIQLKISSFLFRFVSFSFCLKRLSLFLVNVTESRYINEAGREAALEQNLTAHHLDRRLELCVAVAVAGAFYTAAHAH